MFIDIKIYIKDERKRQRRTYSFRLNFETGRLTGSGKVSVMLPSDCRTIGRSFDIVRNVTDTRPMLD